MAWDEQALIEQQLVEQVTLRQAQSDSHDCFHNDGDTAMDTLGP